MTAGNIFKEWFNGALLVFVFYISGKIPGKKIKPFHPPLNAQFPHEAHHRLIENNYCQTLYSLIFNFFQKKKGDHFVRSASSAKNSWSVRFIMKYLFSRLLFTFRLRSIATMLVMSYEAPQFAPIDIGSCLRMRTNLYFTVKWLWNIFYVLVEQSLQINSINCSKLLISFFHFQVTGNEKIAFK